MSCAIGHKEKEDGGWFEREHIIVFIIIGVFLRQDQLSGDVPTHLAQPCCVALGQALDSGLGSRLFFYLMSPSF